MKFCSVFWSIISLLVLVIACLYSWYQQKYISKNDIFLEKINVVIFEFENFQNDLFGTVESFCKFFPNVHVFSETLIYPPIDFSRISKCKIKVIEKQKSPSTSFSDLNPELLIKSTFLLLIPDSTRIDDISLFSSKWSIFTELLEQSKSDALIFPIYSHKDELFNVTCKPISFDIKRWAFHYDWNSNSCEYYSPLGFVVFIKTRSFFKLHQPFSLPFMKSFSIQSHISNLSTQLVIQKIFISGNNLYSTERLRSKSIQLENYRISQLYHDLGIKIVHHLDNSTEWFGCNRHTTRCFGTIINDIPDYLIKNRWTPPCCRKNLEITGRYVIALLDKSRVRYWLEGGSLLGAARNGAIIEWDYDIDIGIYRNDAEKLPILSKLLSGEPGMQIEDGQGFLWEKAIEGDFLKVHFSRTNRIHVDIFAFEAINGTMTKNTWFEDHPQDMPFAENYLIPLTQIKFIGIMANAPNNVRQFLEMKFGKGAIENPKYPRDLMGSDFN